MTDRLFDISGKVALVTGGTSGIGLMIARAFVARGARTYIASRSQDRADTVAAELARAGGHCTGLAADLGAEGGPAALAAAFAVHESRLDVLVNNAGASDKATIAEITEAQWDLVLETNLRAPFFLVQQLLAPLRAAASADSPARIINVGSIGGLHIPNWEAFPYGASKAALHHLTRALAKRFGPEHIVVNAIAPGPFPSAMTDVTAEGTKKAVATYIPAGRPGQADDMAGLAVFLASRAGAYVNGHTIPLDGGYIAAL